MKYGCLIWGFEPKDSSDCPEYGSGRCPCTCGLFDEEDEESNKVEFAPTISEIESENVPPECGGTPKSELGHSG